MEVWLNLVSRLRKFDAKTLGSALLSILVNPKRHYLVFRKIKNFHGGSLIRHQPHLHLKYLNPRHLAHSFSRRQRADALLYNLSFIEGRFSKEAISLMINGGFRIWSFDEDKYLMLRFEHCYTTEGEMTLELRNGNTELYALSFSFICGSFLGTDPAPIMFITRIQGGRGVRALIETTIKSMGQTHPRYVLLAALQGLAKAVGIEMAIGVSAHDQVCRKNFSANESASYEAFYMTLGSISIDAKASTRRRPSATYYKIALPLQEKDIELISASHRTRAKAKRKLRKRISEEVFEAAFRSLA